MVMECYLMFNLALIILIRMVMKEKDRKNILFNLGNQW